MSILRFNVNGRRVSINYAFRYVKNGPPTTIRAHIGQSDVDTLDAFTIAADTRYAAQAVTVAVNEALIDDDMPLQDIPLALGIDYRRALFTGETP